jgi:transposase
MAPYSIGCKAGSALALEAKIMVEELYAIRAQIAEIDRHIKELCKSFFEYNLLLSIPGFGPDVSATVLAAIGNPDRLENAKQVLRLAGLDLNANRSGQKSASAVPIISRKGKVERRYALYQAARIASCANTAFTAYFTKLLQGRERERGIRTKMRVKIAEKLLIIAFTKFFTHYQSVFCQMTHNRHIALKSFVCHLC